MGKTTNKKSKRKKGHEYSMVPCRRMMPEKKEEELNRQAVRNRNATVCDRNKSDFR